MKVETKRCQEHKTPEERSREDHRTLLQKRHGFVVGDKIYATDEYRRLMSKGKEPDFEGGTIVEFKDPWDWEGNKVTSGAYIEMPCGCVLFYNTGWLK